MQAQALGGGGILRAFACERHSLRQVAPNTLFRDVRCVEGVPSCGEKSIGCKCNMKQLFSSI